MNIKSSVRLAEEERASQAMETDIRYSVELSDQIGLIQRLYPLPAVACLGRRSLVQGNNLHYPKRQYTGFGSISSRIPAKDKSLTSMVPGHLDHCPTKTHISGYQIWVTKYAFSCCQG